MTSREHQRHDNGLQLLESMQDDIYLKDRLDWYEEDMYPLDFGSWYEDKDHKDYPNFADFTDCTYYVVDEDDLSRAEERLVSMKQYIEVVIDSSYTSTVRDPDSLRDYLSRQKSISSLFGIIKNTSGFNTQGFIDEVFEIIKDHKERFAENDDRIEYRDFSKMNELEKKAEFKLLYPKGIASDIKDSISNDRVKSARKWNKKLHLVSHTGDGFVCVDNIKGDRGIEDMYGDFLKPSRKGAYEVYCDARELGLKNFSIWFMTSYYIYMSIEDKFAGAYPEHTGDGESYHVIEYKTI